MTIVVSIHIENYLYMVFYMIFKAIREDVRERFKRNENALKHL